MLLKAGDGAPRKHRRLVGIGATSFSITCMLFSVSCKALKNFVSVLRVFFSMPLNPTGERAF